MIVKRWRNHYRVPILKSDGSRNVAQRIGCPLCGESSLVDPGSSFHNHCAQFPTRDKALEYSRRIYNFCEYLGPQEFDADDKDDNPV